MNKQEKNLFNQMIDASFKHQSKLEKGTNFKVEVISRNEDYIFIQTLEKNKLKGIISTEEFENIPEVGEQIEAFFLREQHSDLYFTYCIANNVNLDLLKIAFDFSIPIWGKIQSEEEQGYVIKIGEIICFCPKNQLEKNKLLNNEKLIGSKIKFLIHKMSRNQILVSHKSLKDKERQIQKEILKKELKENMFIDCKIDSIHNFGLLVDFDGEVGLIPISEASFKKKPNLENEFKVGQKLKAKILSLDWQNNKHTLTIKDFLNDPWLKNLPYKEDTIVKGTIDKIESFGLFIKLDDFFHGLVPLKETNVDSRAPLYQFFQKGQEVEVAILEVNPEKKQIAVSIKKAKELRERMEYQSYLTTDNQKKDGYSLGEILKQKLKK